MSAEHFKQIHRSEWFKHVSCPVETSYFELMLRLHHSKTIVSCLQPRIIRFYGKIDWFKMSEVLLLMIGHMLDNAIHNFKKNSFLNTSKINCPNLIMICQIYF